MKKYLTISNLLKCVAVVLGIVAFCLMFGDQVYYVISALGQTSDPYYIGFSETFFGSTTSISSLSITTLNGSIVGFIGYIIVIVAAVLGVLGVAAPKKGVFSKVLAVVIAVLFIAAGVLILCTAAGLNGANDTDIYNLATCPIVAGILAIVGGVSYCLSALFNK